MEDGIRYPDSLMAVIQTPDETLEIAEVESITRDDTQLTSGIKSYKALKFWKVVFELFKAVGFPLVVGSKAIFVNLEYLN